MRRLEPGGRTDGRMDRWKDDGERRDRAKGVDDDGMRVRRKKGLPSRSPFAVDEVLPPHYLPLALIAHSHRAVHCRRRRPPPPVAAAVHPPAVAAQLSSDLICKSIRLSTENGWFMETVRKDSDFESVESLL
ncbi:hypothetical protein LguiB_001053 [Lonicera macranthoides]